MGICQYLQLYMKTICWRFHIKAHFTFSDINFHSYIPPFFIIFSHKKIAPPPLPPAWIWSQNFDLIFILIFPTIFIIFSHQKIALYRDLINLKITPIWSAKIAKKPPIYIFTKFPSHHFLIIFLNQKWHRTEGFTNYASPI